MKTEGTTLEEVARRFPLVPRPRAVCRSLEQRVARVRDRVHLAAQRTDDALLRAAEALNLAALIASDCARPALARELCWRQADVFLTGRPYPAATAKLALQPLINLGRLLVRDGDGDGAYQVFRGLLDGLRSQTDTIVAGRKVNLADLVTREDRPEVEHWMWLVLLVDGTKALARAGRWVEALQHVEQHHGIAGGLLDGRQVAILARATAGDHDAAHRLIASTIVESGWEAAVAACLRTLSLDCADQPSAAAASASAMVNAYLPLPPAAEHAVFQVRLGLSVLDLAHDAPKQARVAHKMTRVAAISADAYAAWDLLTCAPHAAGDDARTLADMVKAAGLGSGEIPGDLLDHLMHAAHTATAVIRDTLVSATSRPAG
jgi:hypothetical protein